MDSKIYSKCNLTSYLLPLVKLEYSETVVHLKRNNIENEGN